MKRSRWFKSLPGFQKFRPSSRASGKFPADLEENFLSVVETKGHEILQYLVCIFQLDNNDQRTKHEFFRTLKIPTSEGFSKEEDLKK